MKKTYFTSEHVSPGHVDKLMDTIAEAIVDYHLDNSVNSRVAVDGLVKNNLIVLAGEITSTETSSHRDIVKQAIFDIGYTPKVSPGFNHEDFQLQEVFTKQSPDIAQGVDSVKGCDAAGDIGIMFGGAVNEAPDYTCWSHYIARLLSYSIFKSGVEVFRPDQKTQVTIEYQDGIPTRIAEIVVCVSHDANVDQESLKSTLRILVEDILDKHQKEEDWNISIKDYKLQINPTGVFALFGPAADSGLVGRKIVCDQYGGFFPVGGGNLNGKDATKVDRSAVYMARFVAKQVVAKKLADLCQIQVAYSIGMIDPVSINIETFGTERVSEEEIEAFVHSFSFRPGDIIKAFKLSSKERTFKYRELGMYGHIGSRFGDELQLPWEVV